MGRPRLATETGSRMGQTGSLEPVAGAESGRIAGRLFSSLRTAVGSPLIASGSGRNVPLLSLAASSSQLGRPLPGDWLPEVESHSGDRGAESPSGHYTSQAQGLVGRGSAT